MSDAFWSHWAWPAATAALGFVFAGMVFRQWLQRRRYHQLAWAVGLLMYAVAAVFEAYSEGTGAWDPTIYRIYIVLAASLVGFLGLGSLYLVTKSPVWGHAYLGFLLVCLAIFLYGVFTTDLVMDKLVPGITVGGQALGPGGSFPRIMSLPFNITGSIFLLGGSILSVFKFLPKREYHYRMWANVLIIIGTLLISAAGGMARAGQTAGLYPAEMVASAILLAGFLMAGTLKKGAQKVLEERHGQGPAA